MIVVSDSTPLMHFRSIPKLSIWRSISLSLHLSTTSQYPPLAAPMRRSKPLSFNLARFTSIFLEEIPTNLDNSFAEIIGSF
jgi:hypothetical protein